jgi:hypothetical protein
MQQPRIVEYAARRVGPRLSQGMQRSPCHSQLGARTSAGVCGRRGAQRSMPSSVHEEAGWKLQESAEPVVFACRNDPGLFILLLMLKFCRAIDNVSLTGNEAFQKSGVPV